MRKTSTKMKMIRRIICLLRGHQNDWMWGQFKTVASRDGVHTFQISRCAMCSTFYISSYIRIEEIDPSTIGPDDIIINFAVDTEEEAQAKLKKIYDKALGLSK